LYHVFFTAGTRIALYQLNIYNLGVHLGLGLFMGIITPILVFLIFDKHSFTKLFFLGERPALENNHPRNSDSNKNNSTNSIISS
jgi:hypothetical protein